MPIKQHSSWLAVCAAFLYLVASAVAQEHQPFAPIDYDEDFQAFEPYYPSDYGSPSIAREGYFFNYERFVMFISPPDQSPIGNGDVGSPLVATGSGFRTQTNSHSNGILSSDDAWGNRYELGYVTDRQGWLVSVLDGQEQDQLLQVNNLDVTFQDQFVTGSVIPLATLLSGFIDLNGDGVDDNITGITDIPGTSGRFTGVPPALINDPALYDDTDLARLAVTYDSAIIRNKSYMDGVELMKLHVSRPLYHGGIIEFQYGVRYLKFRDRFVVTATGGVLGDSFWNTLADNNIVGPQFGLKWYHRKGRWTITSENRFLAGFDIQNIKQTIGLGSNIIPVGAGLRPANQLAFFDPIEANADESTTTFAPSFEVRLIISYNVTADFALRAGYTGYYAWGVARASNLVQYDLPAMGLNLSNNREGLLANMVTFGVEWNR